MSISLYVRDASGSPAPPATRAERALGRELRAERARLLRTRGANAEAERALGDAQGGAGGWGQEACVASDLAAEELMVTLDQKEQRRLADVEAALRRLAQGRYGRCEGCGRPIPAARLRAVPWTRRCVACAGRLDALRCRSRAGRPSP